MRKKVDILSYHWFESGVLLLSGGVKVEKLKFLPPGSRSYELMKKLETEPGKKLEEVFPDQSEEVRCRTAIVPPPITMSFVVSLS